MSFPHRIKGLCQVPVVISEFGTEGVTVMLNTGASVFELGKFRELID